MKNLTAIVLAAGEGTRLGGGDPSPKPKVLYELAGRPMLEYTLDILKRAGLEEIIVVVGYKAKEVETVAGKGYKFAYQTKKLGTGHAVAVSLAKVVPSTDTILVVNGDDSAFYDPVTIGKVINKHVGKGNTITFVSLEPENPVGLGRVIRKGKKVVAIIEEKIASSNQKKIKEVNDGLYIFKNSWLVSNLKNLKKSLVGEYYLVDLVNLAVSQGEKVSAFKLTDPGQWHGVNTPAELEAADKLMRKKLRDASKK